MPLGQYSDYGKSGFSGFDNAGYSMDKLQAIKQKILDTPYLGK
ncbi:MAG: hypothetical protein QM426_03990 [Euryarchaeota archaeon]|nr:hypothetical protein [Euryarchaeota archaeon]